MAERKAGTKRHNFAIWSDVPRRTRGPHYRSVAKLLRHVAERFASQHDARPIRRTPIGRARGGLKWFVGRCEKSPDALRFGDHRQELHAALALRTFENIDCKGSTKKLGPRAVLATWPHGLALCGCRGRLAPRSNVLLGRNSRAPLARRRKHAGVLHRVVAPRPACTGPPPGATLAPARSIYA